ncbi:hypothetical protein B0H13DRAFT_2666105 [Mycena leptocephala]|nr:hypothetical protein B0H13DRAFT_2666105 [Mycena leptocephala]
MFFSSNSEAAVLRSTEAAPPVALIPPEVLCYIFTCVLPVQKATSPAIPTHRRRTWREPWVLGGPWIIGQVCSRWREVALALPTLWTSITVANNLSPRQFFLLKTQLARTGSAPINLLIRFTSGARSQFSEDEFDLFLAMLVSHSTRWRALHLEFDNGWLPPAAFAPLNGQTLPVLEELIFSGRVRLIRNYDFFKSTPALRRVVLGSLGGPPMPDIPLPWAQITSYKGTNPSPTTNLRILAAAANLVECDIDVGNETAPSDVLRHGFLTLPLLRRLSLSWPSLLDCLTAPALQSLYVVGPAQNILPFLDRSCCTSTLAELTLTQCFSPASDITALLRCTRGLTSLALDLHTPPADIVVALTAPDCVCPNLGSLSWADFDDALDRSAFADMVVSRCMDVDGVRPLHSVAHYAGRRRIKGAGLLLRALPALEVLFLNAKKGRSAVARWRGY